MSCQSPRSHRENFYRFPTIYLSAAMALNLFHSLICTHTNIIDFPSKFPADLSRIPDSPVNFADSLFGRSFAHAKMNMSDVFSKAKKIFWWTPVCVGRTGSPMSVRLFISLIFIACRFVTNEIINSVRWVLAVRFEFIIFFILKKFRCYIFQHKFRIRNVCMNSNEKLILCVWTNYKLGTAASNLLYRK